MSLNLLNIDENISTALTGGQDIYIDGATLRCFSEDGIIINGDYKYSIQKGDIFKIADVSYCIYAPEDIATLLTPRTVRDKVRSISLMNGKVFAFFLCQFVLYKIFSKSGYKTLSYLLLLLAFLKVILFVFSPGVAFAPKNTHDDSALTNTYLTIEALLTNVPMNTPLLIQESMPVKKCVPTKRNPNPLLNRYLSADHKLKGETTACPVKADKH